MNSVRGLSRRTAMLASLATGTWFLAACGSDDSTTGTAASSTTSGSASDSFTVEHTFGSTTVPTGFQKVVSVGYTDDQTMLALGIVPIGMVDQYPAGDGPKDQNISWPWVTEAWGDTVPEVILTNGESLLFEKIAALKPDLIVGVYSDITEADYKKLSAIAPTVAWAKDVSDPFSATWEETVTQIGAALNKSSETTQKVDAITAQTAAAKAANPQFAEQTAVVISWYKDSIAAFSSTDVRGKLVADLGFKTVPALDEVIGDDFYATLSTERADLIDVDKVFFIGDTADQESIKADPVYAGLAVVRENRVVYLPDSEGTAVGAALSASSLSSLPFAIEQLTAAAKG